MLRKLWIAGLLPLLLLCFACSKEEGVGGESTISGKVYVKEYDVDFKNLQRVTVASGKDVYINYGSKTEVGDKVTTSYDGTFSFEYLTSGSYKVYAYSDDTSGLDSKMTVLKSVSVGNDQTTTIDSLIIYKALAVDDGNATITGKLWLVNYKSSGTEIKDISLAQEQDVFLIYANHLSYDLHTKTNYDGTFQFTNLLKGNYVVYAYSEDLAGGTAMVAQKTAITISADNQEVAVTDTIVKL